MSDAKRREEFEKWYSDNTPDCRSIRRNGDMYELMQAQLCWETWKTCWDKALQSKPDGFVMVPIFPTEEMIKAGNYCDYPIAADIYTAMIKAAQEG